MGDGHSIDPYESLSGPPVMFHIKLFTYVIFKEQVRPWKEHLSVPTRCVSRRKQTHAEPRLSSIAKNSVKCTEQLQWSRRALKNTLRDDRVDGPRRYHIFS